MEPSAETVWIIGAYSSQFGKRVGDSFKALSVEAVENVLADARFADAQRVDMIAFSNSGMGSWGQASIRGQVCLAPLASSGVVRPGTPVMNVENACASGSTALRLVRDQILSGQADIALAVGVEKLHRPKDMPQSLSGFMGGIDTFDTEDWKDLYAREGARLGKPFELRPDRSVFMDTYAIRALDYMDRHGITAAQIAAAAAKSHNYGADNPRAQYRFRMSVEDVLADRHVTRPFTRAMCAPISDGAAACLLVSGAVLKSLAPDVRERAIRLRSLALHGGTIAPPSQPGASWHAARRAYAQAGLTPGDIDLAEVHDATSYSELFQAEMMGFCEPGEGGRLAESGATGPGGRIPINTSGGLVSKGHPIGATGLSMVAELVEQMRGEAGPRQVARADHALAENGGGVMGFDEAVACVTILSRK